MRIRPVLIGVWLLAQGCLMFGPVQAAERVMNVYLNYYSLPKTALGMDYYLDILTRGKVNRVSFPYDLGSRPDDATCNKFIGRLQARGIEVAGWYRAEAVKDPKAYFAEMFRRFPTLDGVSADDGYELFVGRYAAIQKDPSLVARGVEMGRSVYQAVKAVKPKAFVSSSSTELVDKAPVGVACIKNGTLDYIEPEVYHPVNSPALHKTANVVFDQPSVMITRETMTKAWLQAVGEENAGKLIMLISNYQSSYGNPPKSADIVLSEITGLEKPSPRVGAGLFSLAYVTDEQMDVLGSRKPFDGQLPAGLRRTPGKRNILIHGRIGCYRITDLVGAVSGWLDLWTGPDNVVKLSTFPLINDELLNQIDVYITQPGYYGPYTPEEKQALTRFVNRGGRVLYLAFFAGEDKPSQTLFSDFGLDLTWGAAGAKVGPLAFRKAADHPLSDQVAALPWPWPSAESAEQIRVTGEAVRVFTACLPDGKEELVEVAAWRHRSSGGRIAVVASGVFRFYDGGQGLDQPANRQLAKNLVRWLCE